MVRVQAPALSLEASGSLGGTLVFAKWKGRPYVRTLVKPANPKSPGQVGMRSMFKWLAQSWASIGAVPQATWEDRAAESVISPFNAFCSKGLHNWKDFVVPSDTYPTPGADTIPVLGTLALTPTSRAIGATITVTTANDGWGVLLFMGTATGFTPSWNNLVGVGAVDGTNDVIIIVTPLDPGTYYMDAKAFSKGGLETALIGEQTAVVS